MATERIWHQKTTLCWKPNNATGVSTSTRILLSCRETASRAPCLSRTMTHSLAERSTLKVRHNNTEAQTDTHLNKNHLAFLPHLPGLTASHRVKATSVARHRRWSFSGVALVTSRSSSPGLFQQKKTKKMRPLQVSRPRGVERTLPRRPFQSRQRAYEPGLKFKARSTFIDCVWA